MYNIFDSMQILLAIDKFTKIKNKKKKKKKKSSNLKMNQLDTSTRARKDLSYHENGCP